METQPAPGSLNLEYFLLRAYDAVGSFDVSVLPEGGAALLQLVLIVGMVVSLLLLIMIVWVQIRLHQVEHAGFHALEHAAHDAEHAHTEAHGAGHEEEAHKGEHDERWERIVELAASGNESDWRRAILEADIMLGTVLGSLGYPGASVGEQLRHANPIQLTTLDLAWKAHKVRNDIAHAGESLQLSERDVRATIDYYRRVFEEAGAL